jgi:hypothetical protein
MIILGSILEFFFEKVTGKILGVAIGAAVFVGAWQWNSWSQRNIGAAHVTQKLQQQTFRDAELIAGAVDNARQHDPVEWLRRQGYCSNCER